MSWWGWALIGACVGFYGLYRLIVWTERVLPSDDGMPRRWR